MKKIIVTGHGHTGTTFMVNFLDALGHRRHNPQLEDKEFHDSWDVFNRSRATVFKNPRLMMRLVWGLENGAIDVPQVQLVILMLRDPKRTSERLHQQHTYHPGEEVLEERRDEVTICYSTGAVVHALEEHGVPYVVLQHPRSCLDGEYLFEKLGGPLKAEKAGFLLMFQKACRPEMVKP